MDRNSDQISRIGRERPSLGTPRSDQNGKQTVRGRALTPRSKVDKAWYRPSLSTSPVTQPAAALASGPPEPMQQLSAQASNMGMSTLASPKAMVSARDAPRCSSSFSMA